ncbi:MAG TPA: hypothetical protein VFR74_02360 [Jiangellales bacterium]|nr:hypothetical protein [Jiangellales bacterium]
MTAQVTVALPTLLGLDDAPGELAGSGPVPASVARELAAAASRRLLTDPADGHLLTAPIRAYRPTAAVRAFVPARAGGVCAARGCTARHDLQLDHDTPWPAGPTGAGNTVPLHQPHHDAKTCGVRCHRLHPDSGALTQTSPLGRSYTTVPLPPLGDPDLTALVRARLHRLVQRTRRRGGPSQTTGPPNTPTNPPAERPCAVRMVPSRTLVGWTDVARSRSPLPRWPSSWPPPARQAERQRRRPMGPPKGRQRQQRRSRGR